MNKLYIVKHQYDVDGGYGDAIFSEDVVGIVSCKESEIEAFYKEFNRPETYDIPYADLVCHAINFEEVTPITIDELREDPYGDNGRFQNYIDDFKKDHPNYDDEEGEI